SGTAPTIASTITVNGVTTTGTTRGVLIGADSGTTLTLSGGIGINNTLASGSGTMNLILGGEGTNSNVVSGAITNTNSANVSLNLVKAGNGKWLIGTTGGVAMTSPAINGIVVRGGTLQVNASAGSGGGAGTGVLLPTTAPLTFSS